MKRVHFHEISRGADCICQHARLDNGHHCLLDFKLG